MPKLGRTHEKRLLKFWVIYLGFVAVAWLVNYPGRLNNDSYTMLTQAQQHIDNLDDWHSPAVTWLWSLFTPVLGQPAGALFVQSLLIFAYPVVIWINHDHAMAFGIARIPFCIGYGAFLLALIPLTGDISKDQVLVGLILCILSLVYLRSEFPSGLEPWYWLCQLLLSAMAFLVRPTNFVAIAISGLICGSFVFGKSAKMIILVIFILAGCILAIPATSLIDRVVFGAKKSGIERSLMIFDVAGISSRIKIDLFSELPGWPADRIPRPWECYTSAGWDSFIGWGGAESGDECKQYSELFAVTLETLGIVPVMRWWMGAILRHPYSYIMHRLSHFANLIRHHGHLIYEPGSPWVANSVNSVISYYWVNRSFQIWEPTIRYRPFALIAALVFYRLFVLAGLLLCVVILIWSWHTVIAGNRKLDMVMVLSSAIAIGNLIMLLLFGVSDASRYLLPSVICGGVSLLRILELSLND